MKQLIYWLISKGKFKQFLYWLMGEKAGFTLVGTWNWLWGIPVESGGKIAVEVAKESLESMELSIAQITESVSEVVGAYEMAKRKYHLKYEDYKIAENQAILAHQNGNQEAAKLMMAKAISIEKLLPKIKEKVEQAEKVVKLSRI